MWRHFSDVFFVTHKFFADVTWFKIVTKFWIRIKRTDKSHRCPVDTNKMFQDVPLQNLKLTEESFSIFSNYTFTNIPNCWKLLDCELFRTLIQLILDIKYKSSGVRVTTSTGETHESDFAVMTFSMGVLQNDAVNVILEIPRYGSKQNWTAKRLKISKKLLNVTVTFTKTKISEGLSKNWKIGP